MRSRPWDAATVSVQEPWVDLLLLSGDRTPA